MSVKAWWQRFRCARWRRDLALRAAAGGEPATDDALAAHLARCAGCRRYAAELAQAGAWLRRGAEVLARGAVGEEVPTTLARRWESVVRNGGVAADSRERWRPRASAGWGGEPRVIWGAVAACWVLVGLLHVTAPAAAARRAVVEVARHGAVSWRDVLVVLRRVGPVESREAEFPEAPRPGAWVPVESRRDEKVQRGMA